MDSLSSKTFDDAAFDAAFYAAGEKACSRLGYATPANRDLRVTPAHRGSRVVYRSRAAVELVVDLQQWLVDDDPAVREQARIGLHAIQRRLYTGDRDERTEIRRPSLADRLMRRIWGSPNPDAPEAWWRASKWRLRARLAAILAALAFAAGAAVAISTHHLAVGIVLVLAAGLCDISEGAFGRVVKQRSPILRWLSCIASHLGDMLMIGSIAVAQVFLGNLHVSWLVFAAMMVSLFGALVRVSALQAGHRFWMSRRERYVRYFAVLLYCVGALVGLSVAGAVLAASLVAGYGAWESVKVTFNVLRRPQAMSVAMFVVDNADVTEVKFIDTIEDDRSQEEQAMAAHHHGSTGTDS